MIYVRKEGADFKPGFNLMWRPWIQCYLMLATYNHRLVFGPGYSRITGQLRWYSHYWTLSNDLSDHLQRNNVFSREYVDDNYVRINNREPATCQPIGEVVQANEI